MRKTRIRYHLEETIKTKNKALQNKSIIHLENGAKFWLRLTEAIKQYQEVSLLLITTYKFSWSYFYPKVLKDIELVKGPI
ncbi:hypothetical protein KFZ70_10700 [Tamlana fucoidanivorans]|uniref:Uncharacterized protein n=1 Tax=Allotamlana fucoidanivorans TaxID=2583814 RepID=A0A5C4SP60_9FLAO|nr:hypothetical protein [Tamlana fucoidanivorans]TNJ45670.1 hypothetical protein FGF67_04625 [Tamlana fucoidanivorans]